MSTKYEQDLQEFIDLRARIKKLESALQEIYNLGRKDSDWNVVEMVAREALEETLKEDAEMAHYGDGNWHAATLGQFVGQLVDEGAGGVIYRQVSVTPHEGNQISIKWEVVAVAEGQVRKAIKQYKCESVHKTLIALLNADLES